MTTLDDLLKGYDFAKVKVVLVASLAGKYEGWYRAQEMGHLGLMRAVLSVGARCPGDKRLHLECQVCRVMGLERDLINFVCLAIGLVDRKIPQEMDARFYAVGQGRRRNEGMVSGRDLHFPSYTAGNTDIPTCT